MSNLNFHLEAFDSVFKSKSIGSWCFANAIFQKNLKFCPTHATIIVIHLCWHCDFVCCEVAGSEDSNVYFYDWTRPRHTCVNKLQVLLSCVLVDISNSANLQLTHQIIFVCNCDCNDNRFVRKEKNKAEDLVVIKEN